MNPKYLKGLTDKQKKQKIANIKKSKKLLKQGKKKQAGELAKKRPTIKSKKKGSGTIAFKKKYGDAVKPLTRQFTIKTGVPLKAQKEVFERGEGAFISAGSRPQVSSKEQWAYARLYTFVMDKGTRFDQDLVKKYKINFK